MLVVDIWLQTDTGYRHMMIAQEWLQWFTAQDMHKQLPLFFNITTDTGEQLGMQVHDILVPMIAIQAGRS